MPAIFNKNWWMNTQIERRSYSIRVLLAIWTDLCVGQFMITRVSRRPFAALWATRHGRQVKGKTHEICVSHARRTRYPVALRDLAGYRGLLNLTAMGRHVQARCGMRVSASLRCPCVSPRAQRRVFSMRALMPNRQLSGTQIIDH